MHVRDATKWLSVVMISILLLAIPGQHSVVAKHVVASKVSINFAGWAFAEKASAKLMGQLINQFERENPSITVQLQPIQFFDVRTRLTTLLGAGSPPDVAQSYLIWTPGWAKVGGLEPLDSYLSASQKAAMLDVPETKTNGKMYAVTWSPGTNVMLWNKNVFKAAGLNPNRPPKSWSQMLSDCAAIVKKAGVKCMAQTTQQEPSAWNWWFPQLWALGGDMWNSRGNCALANAPGIAWAKMMREWAVKGYITTGIDGFTMRQVFAQNKAGFLFDGPWMKGILRQISGKGAAYDRQYGVAVRPIGPREREPWTTTADHQLIMFKASQHKKEAWKLISFLLRPDIQVKYYKLLGLVPSMKTAYQLSAFKHDPYFTTFVQTARDVHPLNFGSNWPAVSDTMMKAMQQIVLDGKAPKPALTQACRDIDHINHSGT